MSADTREKVLATTEILMSDRGYEGVSIKDIAAAIGLRTAAIFYHFPTKADLAAAALDRARRDLAVLLAGIDAAEAMPRRRIVMFLETFGRIKTERSAFCFAGILAATRGIIPDPARDAAARFGETLLDWLRANLAASRPDLDAAIRARRALAILALAEGALLVARMQGTPDSYRQAVEEALPALLDG
ncbi:MAG: TetR/AcrR family transcriptional regulator [Hyphomicrobiales bacterium]|nr:TetR/AcrR family transcriptional regulator [Hyphomicrobiales bacterium]